MTSRAVRWCGSAAVVCLLVVLNRPQVVLDAQGPANPTFHKDVLPILQKNCQSCHRPGQVAPMSLLTYEDARPWARSMKAKVIAREMPPWFADPQLNHFANDRRLNDRDVETIVKWVDGGALPGDPADAPPPMKWPAEGWEIQPDVVIDGPEFHVPASGLVEWTDITVPSGLKEDTWVTSIEVRPSEPQVTHHTCIFVKPHVPGVQYGVPEWQDKPRDASGSELPRAKGQAGKPRTQIIGATNEACYLPGNAVSDYRPYHAAKLIPAGADVVFALHYTPNGKAVVDRTRIGLTVAKAPPARRLVTFSLSPPTDMDSFAIPPHDPNWQSPPAEATFTEDAELVSMMPHMHVRAKDMIYRLDYPDGHSEIVLNVPKYDFNWQLSYDLAKPLAIPRGTKLHVDAHYNNSSSNRSNPDPNRTVYWGDQSWEEMMSPFVGVLVDPKVDPKALLKRPTAGNREGG